MPPEYRQGSPGVRPACDLCPLQRRPLVQPDGPVPARICFVGETPWKSEVRSGRGFSGPSGKLLWDWARRGGIERRNVWVTNACLCMPPEDSIVLDTGAELTKQEAIQAAMHACRLRLVSELITVTQADPKAVIVPIGKLALAALSPIPKPKIHFYRGAILEVDLQALWEKLTTGRTDRRIRLDGYQE